MYKRILVATDGSTLSKKAVKDAIALGVSLGADLLALNVVMRYPMSYFEGGATISPQDVGRIEKEWADKGQAIADAVQKSAEAAGLKSSWPRTVARASLASCLEARPSRC
jgi:nucleotide-binding universal stress UspA family protein